ncbi:formate dehydrogenase formation protein [Enterobacterales bacterium]|nr:formate dehydrogenase formation protein [Enterobacterales bacterium]
MSIRIVPEEQLAANNNPAGTLPPLLFANLKTLYQRRADRLRQLAENHPMGDYLNFAAALASAQQQILLAHPLTGEMSEVVAGAPLDSAAFVRTPHWLVLLDALIAALKPGAPPTALLVLERLEHSPSLQREMMATHLLNQDFKYVPADKAPFIWAALSVYWAQMAAQIKGVGRADYGENRQFCPVCGSLPVSGVVTLGAITGLRYLHCSLCETEWHVVRAKCSNCEEMEKLHYWSLDDGSTNREKAVVKAESCGDCGSYLKIIYQEQDPQADAVADDLATLWLDQRMEEKGLASSSLNPFLFPAS